MTDDQPTRVIVAALILAGLVCFQLLLAAGLPLGQYAWGGALRSCPAHCGSAVASELPRSAVWVLAAFFAIGVVMNAISQSKKERRMAFVALSLSALCAIVALGL